MSAITPLPLARLLRVLIVLLAVLAGMLVSRFPELDDIWQDRFIRHAASARTASDVVIVAVDDATLARYPDTPLAFWSPLFARAGQAALQAGARVVALDFMLNISAEEWLATQNSPAARNYDQPLRELIASGKLMLPALQQADQLQLPAPAYSIAVPDFDLTRSVGRVDMPPDADGVIRHLRTRWQGGDPESPRLAMPLLLARHLQPELNPPETLRIAWSGPPGSLPRLPMHQLLASDAASNPAVRQLAGKIVIIGGAYTGLQDWHLTPYGDGSVAGFMSGPELLGQTTQMLLDQRSLQPLSPSGLAGYLLLQAMLLVLFLPRLPTRWVLCACAMLLASLVLAGLLASRADLIFPVLPAQAGVLVCLLGVLGLHLNLANSRQRRATELFGRYVSPAIVNQLVHSNTPLELGGERVEATVMFCDLRDFTRMAEQLPPEDVVELLNGWFERATAVVLDAGGTVDKLIGDALMAEFGAPVHHPDHARRAISAALQLQDAAQDYARTVRLRFADGDLPAFRVGIGLHSGPLVIGHIGSKRKTDYTAIGDTVNVAARLEAMSREHDSGIVASEACVSQIAGLHLGRCSELSLKGRSQPIRAYAVLGWQSASHPEVSQP
ncbi:adenylate/guanylate cyclase domain-containing protein [Chitinilyticum piscinae]|uniref:Adenylate/guanylate cyclase domain-containing protein n=1 Tax=Chitinilyticum piscinae TaxID=2866724 RepID=A0A8J7K8R4_9NEIS|nr:adenylate/guanylate cyclase domain-containing protein [Chitinilyticum piscinae]MBE9609988.1 adenylate/guanylate cyclase domain-containing protein [Chitinilyticum piscinae]